jgi:predicted adenylyl cyclase CyaB
VVYLSEMIQFDPSLAELADLPVGWFAWRPSHDQVWHRAHGEAPTSLDRHASLTNSEDPAATNIEIKARIVDLDRLRATIESLSDTNVEVLSQEDTFFSSPEGRLKLRIFDENSGELIHYHRADTAEPKASRYLIAPTSAPVVMRTILSQALLIVGVVRKRRLLYHVGQTRIHLDQVEGLGDFVELEVVLGVDRAQTREEGIAIAHDLMSRLGIVPDHLVETSYIDMLSVGE